MRKTLHPPPPTFEIQHQNKGIEDLMDIDSNCPYLLFGETTSHLKNCFEKIHQCVFLVTVRKLNVTDGQMGGGRGLQYLQSQAFGAAGDTN